MSLITKQIEDELRELYSSSDRLYHNMSHVESLLALLSRHRSRFIDPEAVEAAIWFHDAIYDTRAKDNEAKSAELAVARLSEAAGSTGSDTTAIDAERLGRIRAMIEATATHTAPAFPLPERRRETEDARMFLDMDLSILAAPEGEFDAYEAKVRNEYAWVDEPGWREGRAAVLEALRERDSVFHSAVFRDELELRARANLTRSLLKLRRVGDEQQAVEHIDPASN